MMNRGWGGGRWGWGEWGGGFYRVMGQSWSWLANETNLVWTRESTPTKGVGTTDVQTTIWIKCNATSICNWSRVVGCGENRLVNHPFNMWSGCWRTDDWTSFYCEVKHDGAFGEVKFNCQHNMDVFFSNSQDKALRGVKFNYGHKYIDLTH